MERQGTDREIEAPGAMDAEKGVDISTGIGENCHLPELHESMEPEPIQRSGRYNLRKSLAWDSAFFTNSGVLDPEELSIIITGADRGEKHLLPGIEEDITRSTESNSTLEGDDLNLETLEDDLFLDIRASIQRSSKKTSSFTISNSKASAVEAESTAMPSLEKEDVPSQNKSPKPGLKKTTGMQTVRISKSLPKQSTAKLGSRKAIKQDTGHSQLNTKIGGTISTLPKPPKGISKSIPTSTTSAKQGSLGTARVKSESGSSKRGAAATFSRKGNQSVEVSALGGVQRVLPKPAVPSKSSFLGSSTTSRVQPSRSSVSIDCSSSISSGASDKSPVMATRRNPLKSTNVGTGPSRSIPKITSRAVPNIKPRSCSQAAYRMSGKISSSVSPASSISECSSVSSSASSSFVVNQKGETRISLDANSCRSIDGGIILRNRLADQTAEGHENQAVVIHNDIVKKSSTHTGTMQPSKPSGLRMPSPKIGFFDGVKTSVRTPTGPPRSQSSLHTLGPKSGATICSPIRSLNNKLKSTKVPTTRLSNASPSVKLDSPKITYSASVKQKSHPSTNNYPCSLSLEVKCDAGAEICQNPEKVQLRDEVSKVLDASTGGIIEDHLGESDKGMDLNRHENKDAVDAKIAFVEGMNASGSKYIGRIGDDVLVNHHHVKSSSSVSKAGEEEKGHHKCDAEVESCQKSDRVQLQDKISQMLDATTGAIIRDHLGDSDNGMDLNMHKHKETVDAKVASVEGRNSLGSKYIRLIEDDVLVDHSQPKSSSPFCKAGEEENDHVKYQAGELTEISRDTCFNVSASELLKGTSDCVLESPATVSNFAAGRTPFAIKNFCDSECVDMSKELATNLGDKTCFALPFPEQKENI